jgi:SAM-dependent methyltransferase
MKLVCPSCHAALPDSTSSGDGERRCALCGIAYSRGESYFRYDFDPLLFKRFKKNYLLNKILNNNGLISYQLLQEGSVSLPDRADVQRFRDFLRAHARAGVLLDAGCGVLELPGYLDFEAGAPFQIVGLDPIEGRTFRGFRVVGCTEFMPFPDASIDTIVFATSLDHVCSLTATAAEVDRILRPGGKVVIWMGDRSRSPWQRIRAALGTWRKNLREGYRTDRYWRYPNGIVLFVPNGAVDPFHAYDEDPRAVMRLFSVRGMTLEAQDARTRDEVFLTFAKPAGAGGAAKSPA